MGADSQAFGRPMDGAAHAPYVVPNNRRGAANTEETKRHDVTDR
jgi:hypothetical protein